MINRLNPERAEYFIEHFPPHRWYYKSLHWLLSQKDNQKNLPMNPLNERLLESVKAKGFLSPFLCMDNWYPICGSQRLRAALELPEEVTKNTFVKVMKLDNTVWASIYLWQDKEAANKAAQIYIETLELVFKSVYMTEKSDGKTDMTVFEIEGDKLHWVRRDGKKDISS